MSNPWSNREPPINVKSLAQFRKTINEFVEEYLHEKFTWGTVTTWIEALLKGHIEDIVLGALGFEYDDHHYANGRRGWKLKDYGGHERGIHKVLQELAVHVAEKHIPKIVKEYEPKFVKLLEKHPYRKQLAREYQEAVDSAIWDRLPDLVKKHAQADVEKLFDLHGDDMLQNVKLKNPLTMHSLELIAAGNTAKDDE